MTPEELHQEMESIIEEAHEMTMYIMCLSHNIPIDKKEKNEL